MRHKKGEYEKGWHDFIRSNMPSTLVLVLLADGDGRCGVGED